MAIALLAFGVWAHHMFAAGLGNTVNSFFSASSLLIGIPTGVKIFNWLATMHGGEIRFSVSMLFAIAFLVEFTIGGLSGITFAIVPDRLAADRYLLCGRPHPLRIYRRHRVRLAGRAFLLVSKDERADAGRTTGQMVLLAFCHRLQRYFLVQHALGVMGMPSRVYTYPDLPGWGLLNLISTSGAFLMAAAVGLLVYIISRGL